LRSYIIAEKEKQPNKFKYFEEYEGRTSLNKKDILMFIQQLYLFEAII